MKKLMRFILLYSLLPMTNLATQIYIEGDLIKGKGALNVDLKKATIAEIKQQAYDQLFVIIPPSYKGARLYFPDRKTELNDNKNLADYGIKQDDTLYVRAYYRQY